jgi:magnesium-protoporphyrin O-methyltransferase
VTDRAFGDKGARADLRDYQRHGPARQTRALLSAVRSLGLKNATLLDIGGGVGTIHHELLEDTVRAATHVDASSAYLREAQAESARLGHAHRVKFVHADFTEVAADLPQADIVTLDRVVCCYPNVARLLAAAAGRSQRALAMTYPRESWYMRLGLKVVNVFQRLRRDPFRVFLHPVGLMDQRLQAEGLRRVALKRMFIWEMALYCRAL